MKNVDRTEFNRYDSSKDPYANRQREMNSNFYINEIRRRSQSAGAYSNTLDTKNLLKKFDDVRCPPAAVVVAENNHRFSIKRLILPISCLICFFCTVLLIWRIFELENRLRQVEKNLKQVGENYGTLMQSDDNLDVSLLCVSFMTFPDL